MPAAKSTTKADKKAYGIEWRKRPESRIKIKANSERYRASPKGRASIRANTEKIADQRRMIAAEKTGFAVAKQGEFYGSAVQRTLNIWGGL